MAKTLTIADYTNGSCNIWAIAYQTLHPEVSIQGNLCEELMNIEDEVETEFMGHAYCVNEEGIYFDAKGTSLEQYGHFFDDRELTKTELINECNSLLVKEYYSLKDEEIIRNERLVSWTKDYLGKKYEKALNDAITFIMSKDKLSNIISDIVDKNKQEINVDMTL